jgi:hypothetical protein
MNWKMNRSVRVLCMTVVSLALLSGCATLPLAAEENPFTLETIVSLAKAGKDSPTIIAEIKKSRSAFDIQASQYIKLAKDGVPEPVLDFMLGEQMKMAQREGRREGRMDGFSSNAFYGLNGARPYWVLIGGRSYLRYW